MVLAGSDLGISGLQKGLFSSVVIIRKMLSQNYHLLIVLINFVFWFPSVTKRDQREAGRVEDELSAAKINHQHCFQICYKTQALLMMTTKPDTKTPMKSAAGTSRQGRQTQKYWTAKAHVQDLLFCLSVKHPG